MAQKIRPEDLSEQDLRRLLIEKRRKARKKRLDEFRRSGRLVELSQIPSSQPDTPFGEFELTPDKEPTKEELRQEKRKRLIDRALLAVEVLAILGLVFVLFNGVGILQQLNEEVAAALVQPTLTPTPRFDLVVLPSGHTPPTSPGGTQFNLAEIPEHLQPVVQAYYENLVIPTPSPEQAVRIEIPAIGISAPIVQGDGPEQLKQGVGQHIGTANPGQPGNLVLSAHNDVFGEIFRHLDKLQAGDEIIVYTNIRSYTYVIDLDTQIVEPTFVQVVADTHDPTITLISCYPYLVNNKRIVVKAALVDG
jgi:sortase A